ncbi:hypothetical protein D9M69_366010 [compost metagenome]
MDDQLHAAGFVEEALHHQALLGRQRTEGGAGAGQVFDDLAGGGFAEAQFVGEPGDGGGQDGVGAWPSPLSPGGRGSKCVQRRCLVAFGQSPLPAGERGRPIRQHNIVRRVDNALLVHRVAIHGLAIHPTQPPLDLLAQARHARRQLVGAPRRLAEPERDGRRHAVGILDAHPPRLDAQDAVGLVAELEHVAGQALDGEILVDRADALPLGFEQHRVVAGLGNGAAGGQRHQGGAAPAAQATVHRVAVQVGGAHAAAAAEAFGEHLQQRVVALPRQVDIGRGAGQQAEQAVLAPLLAGHLGHHLLGQHIERRVGNDQCVQFVAAHAVEQGGALDQVVPRLREQPPLGQPADAVPGAPDALQEAGDAARRAELADQFDVADVDAQFQRGGGHQHLELAALEALLGIQAQLLGQAAVVGGDRRLAEPLGQVAAGALGQAPGVDEHQRGAVFADQCGEAVVDGFPGLVAHHRLERHRRHLDGQVAGARMADVDDRAVAARGLDRQLEPALPARLFRGRQGRLAAEQEARDLVDRLLRGGQTDAQQRPPAQRLQPLEAEHQVAAALAAGDGVDLVDDDAAAAGEHLPSGRRTEQHVERFRGGDEDVRRQLAHRPALGLAGVAGAHRGADGDVGQALALKLGADALERLFEVDMDVVGQRLERRHVDHRAALRQHAAVGQPLLHQFVDGGEEGGQRLARTGGRGDQRRAPGADRRPGAGLRRGRRRKGGVEPGDDRRMETVQGGGEVGGRGSRGHAAHYGGAGGGSQGR